MRRALVGTLLLLETASVPAQWVADRRVRLLMLLDAGDTVAPPPGSRRPPPSSSSIGAAGWWAKAVGSRPWLGDKGRARFAALLAPAR